MILQVEDIFPPSFSSFLSLVPHLASVSVPTGSIRRYVDPTDDPQLTFKCSNVRINLSLMMSDFT